MNENIKNLLKKARKNSRLLIILSAIIVVFFGFGIVKNALVSSSFFGKYNVLTVKGHDNSSLDSITLNGKTIEKTSSGNDWTNVLPIKDSLDYLLLTSSYSKGHAVQCGDTMIPKKVEQFYDGENSWCIHHNNKDIVSITSSIYFPYDTNEIVYEKCLKTGYYESLNEGSGFNSCAERGLFLNDKQIATTKEHMGLNYATNKPRLEESSSFNYKPSKKLGGSIIYSTEGGTYAYDIASDKTTRLADNSNLKLDDIFLTEEGKTILVEESNSLTEKTSSFLGKVAYNGQTYTNIYSAEYTDNHFYILKVADTRIADKGSGKIVTYELLRDGKKVENMELETSIIPAYSDDVIQQFPYCETSTLVCIYEDGHYAYTTRTNVPDVFGYDYFIEEMIIDGEWRGDHIPNLIGRSKPIFENDKLKYIVYTDLLAKGLYLINFDNKWTFKDIFYKKGPAITKILGGYQSKLLNVVKR